MLRWLLLIPFAYLIAMAAGLFALMVASVVSPDVAMMIGGGVMRLFDLLFDLAESGIDPAPAAQAAASLIARLGFSIVVAPVLVLALSSELLRIRSAIVQIGIAGLVAALLPLAMLRLSRAPTGPELQVVAGLFLVGAASGFVYWLIAGRDAGGERVAG